MILVGRWTRKGGQLRGCGEREEKRGTGRTWRGGFGRGTRLRNATPHAAYPEQAVRDPAQTA